MFEDAKISVLAGRNGARFAERMCRYMRVPLSQSEIITFSEGTSFVRVNESVRDRDVYLICPIGMDPNNEFVELLFWLDALRRSSARTVTAVMPYFGYGKGDKKDEPRVSVRARVCADCIETMGADRIMVMDLHASQIVGFFTKPMDHLYALPLLCRTIQDMDVDLANTVVVSPDAGFAKQARRYGKALGLPVAIGDKRRHGHDENAEIVDIIGDVRGKNALIVDDFTISGGTLIHLADQLKAAGAKRFYVLLAHNIITKEGVGRINDSPIELVLSTDTVDNPNIMGERKFATVSVAPLFAETIVRYHNYESISPLFDSVPEAILPFTRIER